MLEKQGTQYDCVPLPCICPPLGYKMNLKSNSSYTADAENFFSKLKFDLYTPKDPWPERSVCSASQLRYQRHFKALEISDKTEKEKLNSFFKSFHSKRPRKDYELHVTVTQVLADLAYSSSILLSTEGNLSTDGPVTCMTLSPLQKYSIQYCIICLQ